MAKGPPDPCPLWSVETEVSLYTPKNLNLGLIVLHKAELYHQTGPCWLNLVFSGQVEALISEKETDNTVLPKTPLCFCSATFLICVNIEGGESDSWCTWRAKNWDRVFFSAGDNSRIWFMRRNKRGSDGSIGFSSKANLNFCYRD